MAILYISLTINIAFVFNWFFIPFLGLQQCSIPHSQIYNFLIVWPELLIFGISIHQLIWIHCSWLFFTCDLDIWTQGENTDCYTHTHTHYYNGLVILRYKMVNQSDKKKQIIHQTDKAINSPFYNLTGSAHQILFDNNKCTD